MIVSRGIDISGDDVGLELAVGEGFEHGQQLLRGFLRTIHPGAQALVCSENGRHALFIVVYLRHDTVGGYRDDGKGGEMAAVGLFPVVIDTRKVHGVPGLKGDVVGDLTRVQFVRLSSRFEMSLDVSEAVPGAQSAVGSRDPDVR